MIKYSTRFFGLLILLQCKGSVFPKSILMAVPNAVLAMLMHTYVQYDRDSLPVLDMNGIEYLWTGYTSILGFLIVFRNNQAYQRFWEGATLIHQVRGEWFNALSSLFAFCDHTDEHKKEVKVFQHTSIRLFSLLYCSALQQVCDTNDDCFEIIETQGLEAESLDFMRTSVDRCQILVQWIQRLIVEANQSGVIDVPAPLLTRSFQELSRGIVLLNNTLKIKEIPFPFPYAQLLTSMLIFHWVITPFIASQLIESQLVTGVTTFAVTFVLWCLIFITIEIDQPFGDDLNDLPLHEMQKDFNHSLLTMLHPLAQRPPSYDYYGCEASRFRPSLASYAGSRRSGYGEDDEATSVSEQASSLKKSKKNHSSKRMHMRSNADTAWLNILRRSSGSFGKPEMSPRLTRQDTASLHESRSGRGTLVGVGADAARHSTYTGAGISSESTVEDRGAPAGFSGRHTVLDDGGSFPSSRASRVAPAEAQPSSPTQGEPEGSHKDIAGNSEHETSERDRSHSDRGSDGRGMDTVKRGSTRGAVGSPDCEGAADEDCEGVADESLLVDIDPPHSAPLIRPSSARRAEPEASREDSARRARSDSTREPGGQSAGHEGGSRDANIASSHLHGSSGTAGHEWYAI